MAAKLQGMCGIAPGGAIMAATHKTKGAFEGAEGAVCLNGSSGSPKSSFSSLCAGLLPNPLIYQKRGGPPP